MALDLTKYDVQALLRLVEAQISINPSNPYVDSVDLTRLKDLFTEQLKPTNPGIWRDGCGDFTFSLFFQGNKVAAIKVFREVYGIGLKDSKDIIDTAKCLGSIHQLVIKDSASVRFDKFASAIGSLSQSNLGTVWVKASITAVKAYGDESSVL